MSAIPHISSSEFLIKSRWLLIYNMNFKRAFYVREIPERHRLRYGDVVLYNFESHSLARDCEYLINRAKKANRTYWMVTKILENNVTQCTNCKKLRRHRVISHGSPVDLCRQCVSKLIAKHPRTTFVNSKKLMWHFGDDTNIWNNSMYRLSYKGYVYMFQKYNISLCDLAKEKYSFPSEFKKKYVGLLKKYEAKIKEYNSYTQQKGRSVKKHDYPQLYVDEIESINRRITGFNYAILTNDNSGSNKYIKSRAKRRKMLLKPKRQYESQWAKYEREKQELLSMIAKINSVS